MNSLFASLLFVFVLWVSCWFYWQLARMTWKVCKFIVIKLDEPSKPWISDEQLDHVRNVLRGTK